MIPFKIADKIINIRSILVKNVEWENLQIICIRGHKSNVDYLGETCLVSLWEDPVL